VSNKGFLLVLMQPPPALEEEFNAWYDTEHVPERAAVPGFESARRYVCIDGHPRYLAMYDMVDEGVLQTEGYLAVSGANFSPWTKRVTSRVKIYRSAGQQIYPGGQVTVPTVRATLLRFGGLPASAAEAVIAGMRRNFEGRADTVQVRVFANPVDGAVDFLGLVASSSPDDFPLDMAAFGEAAAVLNLANRYALY
jgi:hypothetical protein